MSDVIDVETLKRVTMEKSYQIIKHHGIPAPEKGLPLKDLLQIIDDITEK